MGRLRSACLVGCALVVLSAAPALALRPPVLPAWLAALFGETKAPAIRVSDDEVEMNDRIQHFLYAVQSHGIFDDLSPLQVRTGLLTGQGEPLSPAPYYQWLHEGDVASSTTRYSTMSDDVDADLGTIPGAFASICKVEELDRERAIALADIARGGPPSHTDVAIRRRENQERIGWFAHALRYRYKAYGFALDHLLVETPDPIATEIDAKLARLEIDVVAAERRNFCGPPQGAPVTAGVDRTVIPSRFVNGNPQPVPVDVGTTGSATTPGS